MVIGEACGRVNLIGEHTDYNSGFVLPTPIPQKTVVELRPNDGRKVRVQSDSLGQKVSAAEYELGSETKRGDWSDYVQAITWALQKKGHELFGFDARITSSVPIGSGLSSSAALEIALIRALRSAFGLALDDLEAAKIGQFAENEFVGAKVGIMDQMSASLAHPGEALFIDTRDLSFRRILLPADLLDLVVIQSGITHDHASNEYNKRRAECEEACEWLGVDSLREVTLEQLATIDGEMPKILWRRASHVVSENARVLNFVAALEKKQIMRLGELLNQSHSSLRDDYEVSVPAIDTLVEIAQGEATVFGARMTGGGFGGSILVLAREGTAAQTSQRILEQFRQRQGNDRAHSVPQAV
jgi:galactokinase